MLEKNPRISSVIAKRRCLYCILVLVMFIIAANVGITALLLYYINLSKHSIGDIKLESGRTTINGDLLLENSLVSELIQTYNGSLQFLSNQALRMEAKPSAMVLDTNGLLVQASSFSIKNGQKENVLFVSPEYVETHFGLVRLHGKAKAVESLQAQQVVSSNNMKISSPTKNLQILANQHMELKTTIGGIQVKSLKDIVMEAGKVSFYFWGHPNSINFYLQISLGSRDVFLPELKGLQSLNATQVNEVCLCSDGSFYAADINIGCFDSARKNGFCQS